MKLIPVVVLALLSSAVAQTATLHEAQHAAGFQEPQVTLCDLVAHPKEYAEKPVTMKAALASGMEFSIFTDDSCQPAPDKTKLILAKLSSSQFESPLGKKLSKLLKQKQRAESLWLVSLLILAGSSGIRPAVVTSSKFSGSSGSKS